MQIRSSFGFFKYLRHVQITISIHDGFPNKTFFDQSFVETKRLASLPAFPHTELSSDGALWKFSSVSKQPSVICLLSPANLPHPPSIHLERWNSPAEPLIP